MALRRKKDKDGQDGSAESAVSDFERLDGPAAAPMALGPIEEEVRRGGVALYLADGTADDVPYHVVPVDVATSLRYMLSRMQQTGELGERQTVAVTSALEGEGVSSTARSLAALIANDLDHKVCIVEANWWRPEDEIAPAGAHPGLAGVLDGSITLERALVPTSDVRMAVLPAGQVPLSMRSAVVGRAAFTDTIELLTKWFDTVIIDTPPILKSSEATSIAHHAEATILVVRQGVTTERQVKDAVAELEGTHILGVIVNRWSTRVPKRLRRFTLNA